MTREEVMAMTDEQLRIKAGELCGWISPEVRYGGRVWGYREVLDYGEHDGWDLVPDYPNNMSDAWGLAVDAILSVIRCENKYWVGKFDGSNGDWWFEFCPIIDESPSRAITKAFILAMDGDDE